MNIVLLTYCIIGVIGAQRDACLTQKYRDAARYVPIYNSKTYSLINFRPAFQFRH